MLLILFNMNERHDCMDSLMRPIMASQVWHMQNESVWLLGPIISHGTNIYTRPCTYYIV